MDNEEREYTIEEVVALMLIEQMKANIEVVGNERVWKSIERLAQAKVRIRYRALFFKVYGQIPKSNLKELGL